MMHTYMMKMFLKNDYSPQIYIVYFYTLFPI